MNKIRIPYGLQVLRVLSYFRLFSILISVLLIGFALKLSPQIASIIPSVMTPFQQVTMAISLVTVISVLIAIQKRSIVLYTVATVGYSINVLMSLYGLFGVQFFVMLSGFLLTAPSFFLLWYWIQMKPYFQDRTFNPDTAWVLALDRRVNPFLITWVITVIAVMIFSTLSTLQKGFEASNEQNVYLEAFKGKSFKERNEYCLSQLTTEKRDICLFSGFSYTKNKDNITVDSCNLITSDGLRMTCYATIGECSLITERTMRNLCEIGKKK